MTGYLMSGEMGEGERSRDGAELVADLAEEKAKTGTMHEERQQLPLHKRKLTMGKRVGNQEGRMCHQMDVKVERLKEELMRHSEQMMMVREKKKYGRRGQTEQRGRGDKWTLEKLTIKLMKKRIKRPTETKLGRARNVHPQLEQDETELGVAVVLLQCLLDSLQ